jgi:carbon monoxide dehydrogenase subunit G
MATAQQPGPERVERALSDPMQVAELAGGIYEVQTLGGDNYRVDVETGTCLCDDYEYRGEEIGACKHIIRVRAVHEGRVIHR